MGDIVPSVGGGGGGTVTQDVGSGTIGAYWGTQNVGSGTFTLVWDRLFLLK